MLLSKLGISKSNVADIQKVPWQQLLAAQVAAVEEGAYFSAVLDGSYLPAQPFYPSAAPGMTPVSLMVGTTLEDTGGPYFHDWGLDEAGLIRGMDERFGGKGGEIVGLYRKYYPRKSPFLIEAQIMTDASNRLNAVRQAELKTQQRGGSAYLYRWDWPSPPGTLGATHGADAAAALRILGSPLLGVGVGSSSPPGAELPEGILMSARLAAAWVAFAKTGSPNNPLIPSWEPYNLETRPTMVFDVNTRLENDPQAELRHYWPPAPEGRVLKRGPDGLPHIASLI
ncbi:MAG: carboxylesterase family protein [Caulobacteraceae bacterium]